MGRWSVSLTMNQRAKLVVTDFISEPLDHERRILGDLADVVPLNAFSEDDLVGRIEDADAEEVLKMALGTGVKRVVVKRPRLSRELLNLKPVRMEGKSTRYDVYF